MDSAGIPWYSTGTVNVTQGSSNVAGVGTNWVNAGLKVGDIFTIDKSRLYQITAVNSNTSLTLQEAYQGATGTAQVYFVIRNFAGTMQAQIAAQVSELVNKYESYIDTELKQITGPAGPTSFPYRGTWATGRSYNGLDVVQYNNQLYVALYGHTSTSANAPGASGTAWKVLVVTEDAVDTGWLRLSSEYFADMRYRKRNGIIFLRCNSMLSAEKNEIPAGSITDIAELPVGYRPDVRIDTLGTFNVIANNAIYQIRVNANGVIQIQPNISITPDNGSQYVTFSVSFPPS